MILKNLVNGNSTDNKNDNNKSFMHQKILVKKAWYILRIITEKSGLALIQTKL